MRMMPNFINKRLSEILVAIHNIDESGTRMAVSSLIMTLHTNSTIYVCGNGGSAATASHFKNDLEKWACADSDKKFNVVCLNDNIPLLTALSNDISYEDVFLKQIEHKIKPEDIFIAISSSGNSPNILKAARYAQEHDAFVISMTGGDGGALCPIADLDLHAYIKGADNIEDVHMVICHTITATIHKYFENLKVKT